MTESNFVTIHSLDSSPTTTVDTIAVDSIEGHNIDESRTLFLGDLPITSTAQQVTDIFVGLEICLVDIKVINCSKGALCYAFVTFPNTENAQKAVDMYATVPCMLPDGTRIRVGWAKRNSRLHISNLDHNTTELDIDNLFSKFGSFSAQEPILIIKKPSVNPLNPNQIVCYVVINFEDRENAENARASTNMMFFNGRRIRVEWNRASRKSLTTRYSLEDIASGYRGSTTTSSLTPNISHSSLPNTTTLGYYNASNSSNNNQNSTPPINVISIYVQFETIDPESQVSEQIISEIFEIYGNMTGCFIKTNNTSVSGVRQHGYAFVHFEPTIEGKKSALAASNISKETPVLYKGILFHAEISKNFKRATSSHGDLSYRGSGSTISHPIINKFSHLGSSFKQTNINIDHVNGNEGYPEGSNRMYSEDKMVIGISNHLSRKGPLLSQNISSTPDATPTGTTYYYPTVSTHATQIQVSPYTNNSPCHLPIPSHHTINSNTSTPSNTSQYSLQYPHLMYPTSYGGMIYPVSPSTEHTNNMYAMNTPHPKSPGDPYINQSTALYYLTNQQRMQMHAYQMAMCKLNATQSYGHPSEDPSTPPLYMNHTASISNQQLVETMNHNNFSMENNLHLPIHYQSSPTWTTTTGTASTSGTNTPTPIPSGPGFGSSTGTSPDCSQKYTYPHQDGTNQMLWYPENYVQHGGASQFVHYAPAV